MEWSEADRLLTRAQAEWSYADNHESELPAGVVPVSCEEASKAIIVMRAELDRRGKEIERLGGFNTQLTADFNTMLHENSRLSKCAEAAEREARAQRERADRLDVALLDLLAALKVDDHPGVLVCSTSDARKASARAALAALEQGARDDEA